MQLKKLKFGILEIGIVVFSVLILLVFLVNRGFSTDAGDDYYSGNATAGAWYDESWEATGFFRLQKDTTVAPFNYTYYYIGNNPMVNNTTRPNEGAFNHDQATIPQDIVVTQWNATGHVHFQ